MPGAGGGALTLGGKVSMDCRELAFRRPGCLRQPPCAYGVDNTHNYGAWTPVEEERTCTKTMESRAHHDDACGCHADPAPASQSLDEMAFAASACSAAQSGDLKGLQRLYDRARSPSHLLAGDGYRGEFGRGVIRQGDPADITLLTSVTQDGMCRFIWIHTFALCCSGWTRPHCGLAS